MSSRLPLRSVDADVVPARNSTLDLVVKAADAGAVHTPQPAFLVVLVAFGIDWWASLLVENVGWPILLRLRNCGANQKVMERFRRSEPQPRAVPV